MAILSQINQVNEQKTLDDYFPHWMRDADNWKLHNEIQDSLTKEDQRKAFIILNNTTNRWKVRLRK